ncbi:MAG: zinc ABC transporter substrate-binding protein, partial [Porphyromonadaceae bacterium]|nr:zinc ABC transporter substrate-binding protein [Porphyromonadaceae bacterium]
MICSSLHRPLCTLLLGIGLLASSCQQGEQRSTRLQIATTIAPAAQVITEIADSLVTVTTLLPQGNNPENYEPTPQAIQALASSVAYFYMGDLGFERSWVERIHTMQPALQLVRLDQDLVEPAHLHSGNPTNLHDPHYWTSVRGLQSMGKSIYSSLCRIDTMH